MTWFLCSAHYPYRIVTLKEIMSKLTILRDRTIAIMWKECISLWWCERQLGHDIKTNDGWMAICQVISILHLYPHVYTQEVTNCRSEKWTTNFCSLKKQTYQDTTKFCSLKDQEYYMPEKQTTNLCNLKKHILQTFLVDGISKFCSLKSNFCTLSVNFAVFVWLL